MTGESIQIEPTAEVLKVVSQIDKGIGRVLKSTASLAPGLGKFEAPIEAWNLLKLVIRYVEGVLTLAREDLVLLPSAIVLSRSAFESSVKLRWLLAPDDDFDREARWLAHLKTEIAFLDKCDKALQERSNSETKFYRAKNSLQEFHDDVSDLLPATTSRIKQTPNVYDMLKILGEEERYSMYFTACQYSHSTHFATGMYRRRTDKGKQLGEFIKPNDWNLSFRISWYALLSSGLDFINKNGGDARLVDDPSFLKSVESSINGLDLVRKESTSL